MIFKQIYSVSLRQKTLLAVYFQGQKYELYGYKNKELSETTNDLLEHTKSWLTAYFASD